MADKAIGDLNVAPGSIDDANTLFVVQQSGAAYKVTGHEFITALGTILDGHGGVKSIVYTPPVPPSLEGTMVITLADNSTTSVVVDNGKGITSIAKTATAGLVDTYTISYNDGTTTTFSVTNGAKGDQGDAWYVWIRYAGTYPTQDSDMGTTPDNWIGIYSGTEDDPSDLHYTDFDWFEYKGEKGDTGDPATVVSQSVGYLESSSGTVAPSGSWSSTVPSVTPGNFLWTRTQVQFNTGTRIESYSVSRYGIDGSGAVSTVNNEPPDSGGNVALDASDIPMSDNQSVEAHVGELKKYMAVVGDADFEEEAYDSQISATVQWYGFTPESGAQEIDLKDGDLILIKFPIAHPWITANPTRVGIVTPSGYTYYLISGSEVTGTGEYLTHFVFRFNGTLLIPVDINGMTEKLDVIKTNIIQSAAYAVTANGTTSHSLTGLTADHVVGNWGMFSDSGLTTPIPENAPTCDIEITTGSGSWSITIANFTASFYIAPTFIKD